MKNNLRLIRSREKSEQITLVAIAYQVTTSISSTMSHAYMSTVSITTS